MTRAAPEEPTKLIYCIHCGQAIEPWFGGEWSGWIHTGTGNETCYDNI